MYKFYLVAVLFFILGLVIKYLNPNQNAESTNNYLMLKNPMTETELQFCKQLRNITDKHNLIVIPQIQLQKIFKTYNKNDIKAFNKIKAKSIDFAIVDQDYNYKLFVELDDYSHKRQDRINRDIFINDLFNKYNMKLIRIKTSKNYNLEHIEKILLTNDQWPLGGVS